jgi:hypothetical protein
VAESGGGSRLLMIAVGCCCALFLGTCGALGGSVVYFLLDERREPVAVGPVGAPSPVPVGAPSPVPVGAPAPVPVAPDPAAPPPLPPPLPPSAEAPRLVRATVSAVEGAIAIAPGASCGFGVDRRDRADGTYLCNAQIVCGGQLIYGGSEAGYFPCTLHEPPPRRDVVGGDPSTTSIDRDAALTIDTTTSTLEVWDDERGALGRFRVSARVDAVE